MAKIDLKKHRVSLSREQEKKRKRDDLHQHRLTEIAAREASSKIVKETAASQKTRIKEKALETSTQRVQMMLETYQGTNSGQFPNGRTNLENVSIRTVNSSPHYGQLTLLFFSYGCEQTFTDLGLVTRMTSGAVARHPDAAAALMTCKYPQTTVTQHYGAGAFGSERETLPPGWMELTDAASNRPCFFHKSTGRMVFSST